ncbi:pimeloyl-ACP methyl ester carboxylesterase/DNA-binding NarL/FixJ family response regulator [Rubricella aquisinus]|uniref:Pimeloyl-ACP methyl ester carboxylesterase/DNA-binding NarL/FixJ family response regulator n=1 Tax=Rubricella aquisinus TaxID=2028108 RepID=A0A840WJ18_9RHOB|nr:alpha/beta fold hydrolase [Rubricella aquisinus]MBB5515089.1 pimeloyl-ACP methyl ester carboxylesterase/DNA-binding NarL/FixJ family response regulator [Rubricella aquisinus]
MQADQSQFIGLLDHIYEAAEDPRAFDALLEAAEALFLGEDAPSPVDAPPVFDAALLRHSDRVQRIIDARFAQVADPAPDPMTPLISAMRESAFGRFVLARGGVILAGNNAAAAALCLEAFPATLAEAQLDHAGQRALEEALRAASDGATKVIALGVGPEEKRCLAMIRPVTLATAQGAAVLEVALSHIVWGQAQLSAVADALDLSPREGEVLSALLQGQSQAEIAAAQNRSAETIKAQAKAILRKSGCAQVSEVVLLATSIAYLARAEEQPARIAQTIAPTPPAFFEEHRLTGPDGRQIGYLTCGVPQGFPVFFTHAQLQGPYITRAMAEGLAAAGFTFFAVSRPGYGQTDPAPAGTSPEEAQSRDAEAVANHHAVTRLLLMTQHGGTLAACHLANRFEARARGLLLVNGMLPTSQVRRFSHRQSQLFRAAVARAPAIGEMLLRVHLSTYRREGGIAAYWRKFFADQPRDLAALDDPDILDVFLRSGDHVFSGEPREMIRDAAQVIGDWRAILQGIPCRISILYGSETPEISQMAQEEWGKSFANYPVTQVEGAGSLLLHTDWETVIRHLIEMRDW